MVIGNLGVGTFEGSVGFGNILEFTFTITILGDIRMKALGQGTKSRFDLRTRSASINLQGYIVVLASH